MPRVLKLRAIAALAILIIIAVPSAEASDQDADSALPVLTNTTIIEGIQTGKITVEVPAPATLDMRSPAGEVAGFEISGGDGFAGVLITSADTPGAVGTTMYLGMRAPETFDSYDEITLTNEAGDEAFCVVCPLAPGRYNIYLLTTEPASLTLTVDGLSTPDETPVHQAEPVPTDFMTPAATDIDLPGDSSRFWSASAAGQLQGTGTLIRLYLLEGPATEAVNVVARGSCTYGPQGPTMGIVAPGCPGGDHNFDGLTTAIQSPYGEGRIGMAHPIPATSSGLGVYAKSVGASASFAFTGIWLTF